MIPSSKWAWKGQGYESLPNEYQRSRSNSSSGSGSNTPPTMFEEELYHHHHSRRFPSGGFHKSRRYRRELKLVLIVLVTFITFRLILQTIFMPPSYAILPPESYIETLESTLRDRIPINSSSVRAALYNNLEKLRAPHIDTLFASSSMSSPPSLVPNTIFSSDKEAAPSNWAQMWKEMGFEAKFYNDQEADEWVQQEYKGTQVIEAWRDLPRAIL
jgi:hypothetical protein